MPLEVSTLTELDNDLVATQLAYVQQLAKELEPSLDTKRGPVKDLVLQPYAVLSAADKTLVDRVRRSNSLLAIESDPALADEELVDALLSTFRTPRLPGSQASGTIAIVLSQQTPITIPAGATFAASGQLFATTVAYAVRLDEASVILDTDRLLQPVGDGTYYFVIDVLAAEAGLTGMLRRNTKLTPEFIIPRFVTAYAASDFTGGQDDETNAELPPRLQSGVPPTVISNRMTTLALLRAQPGFESLLGVSVLGMADIEMQRDQHGILPMSGGGKTDVYVRTRALPQSLDLEVTATYLGPAAGGTLWQFALTRDDAPGFYQVDSVRLPESAATNTGYELTADVRTVDFADDDYTPDIELYYEGTFSRYSAGVFRFLDTDTTTSGLTAFTSTKTYRVAVSVMPGIKELQDICNDLDLASPTTDILIKAAIPCFVSLYVPVVYNGTATIDTAGITSAAADYVNKLGFAGRLYAADFATVLSDFPPEGAHFSGMDLVGRVLRPNLSVTHMRSSHVLEIPNEPELLVSSKTVVFILDAVDIVVEVVHA